MAMAVQPAAYEADLYLPKLARLRRAETMSPTERYLEFEFADGRPRHRPGQFMEVSVFGIGEAPISISSSPSQPGVFEMCVRRLGGVTTALHRLAPGDMVGMRGPLGNGFPLEDMEGCDLLFVAAGLGVAPLRSLINYALDNREAFGEVVILCGAKTPEELLFREEMDQWVAREDVECLVTVDRQAEGWRGHVGVITTLFPLVKLDPRSTFVAMCGPPVMYRFALIEAINMGVAEDRILLDLERRMKCGVGKCGHCQMNSRYVCTDGPVFRYAEIRFMQEAL
jgi:NAD(P)H-flavin reductase